jgi:hypothetical protein
MSEITRRCAVIISAERSPLLDIGHPPRVPHPADSRDLYQVISLLCEGPSGTWSQLENLSAPAAICFTCNVPRPLPLKFNDSKGSTLYIPWFCCGQHSDAITQRNSKHNPLPLGDFEPSYRIFFLVATTFQCD